MRSRKFAENSDIFVLEICFFKSFVHGLIKDDLISLTFYAEHTYKKIQVYLLIFGWLDKILCITVLSRWSISCVIFPNWPMELASHENRLYLHII